MYIYINKRYKLANGRSAKDIHVKYIRSLNVWCAQGVMTRQEMNRKCISELQHISTLLDSMGKRIAPIVHLQSDGSLPEQIS